MLRSLVGSEMCIRDRFGPCGFIFVSQWYVTKYYVPRSDGYRLIFWASIAGSLLLFLAAVGTLSVLSHPSGKVFAECWHVLVPLEHSGKAALAFLMGAFLWWPSSSLSENRSLFGKRAFIQEHPSSENKAKVLGFLSDGQPHATPHHPAQGTRYAPQSDESL